MNCSRCEELLSDYLEDALDRSEREAVALHLESCAACNELAAGMATVVGFGKTFPVYKAPVSVSASILACTRCEALMSDYLEGALIESARMEVSHHLETCVACLELARNMSGVLEWGKTFPVYDAPSWLPTRIVANTPQITRERWIDTLVGGFRWLANPRVAMGLFTATLVLGWLGSLAGVSSPDLMTIVRNPSAIYYEAQGAVNRAYDGAVRKYYQSPVVAGIRMRIEQLREIS